MHKYSKKVLVKASGLGLNVYGYMINYVRIYDPVHFGRKHLSYGTQA